MSKVEFDFNKEKFNQFVGYVAMQAMFSFFVLIAKIIQFIAYVLMSIGKGIESFFMDTKVSHKVAAYGTYNLLGIGSNESNIYNAELVRSTVIEPVTDLIAAIEGKQVMLIGESGSGKSTVAQWLAYSVGGNVKVIEPEGTPDDWQGLEVIGEGEDWESINELFEEELNDISNQIKLRLEKGDSALIGTDTVTIVEEYPEVREQCSNADKWLEKNARRGRKARKFKIILGQYDRVGAWGLEGKYDLIQCFIRIRLGKQALLHAKSLKKPELIDWLRSDRSHAMIEDEPLKLPSIQEMKSYKSRLHSQTTKSLPESNRVDETYEPKEPIKTTNKINSIEIPYNPLNAERMIQLFERYGELNATKVANFHPCKHKSEQVRLWMIELANAGIGQCSSNDQTDKKLVWSYLSLE